MRRRIFIWCALVPVLLGLVTSIAIAWGFALWGKADSQSTYFGDVATHGRWIGQLAAGPALERHRFTVFELADRVVAFRGTGAPDAALNPPGPAPGLPQGTSNVITVLSHPIDGQPSHVHIFNVQPLIALEPPWWVEGALARSKSGGIAAVAAGWPARCLHGLVEVGRPAPDSALAASVPRGLVRLRSADPARGSTDGYVPVLPLWRGLLLNTGAWSACWLVLILGVIACWHNRRPARWKRRGLCIKCGYDLLGAYEKGCPECGWGRGRGSEPATGEQT